MSTAPKNTPWGKPQTCTLLAEGIWTISTASHGGLKLDRERNAKIPASARRPSGWYEEDCDWSIVALVFPDPFTAEQRKHAEKTAKDWRPEAYTAITGKTVAIEESFMLRRAAFERETHDKFVVRAAFGGRGVGPGTIRVLARRASTGEEATFLVDTAEYTVGELSFVIDEARHAREDNP